MDYTSAFGLADYERVIGTADRNVRGTFYALGAHLVTLEPNVLPFRQVRSWFFPPEADGEYAVGHGPGRCMRSSSCPSRPASPKKGHAYYMENRVVYLSVDGTTGHAIVSGTVPYEITFTYADGSVSALTCGCYETGCASTAPPCCCSCVKRWRRFTSTGRMPLPRTDISPL